MITIRTVDQLEIDTARVFYRVDYNVPMENGVISDTTRIEATLPTLRMMRERGARIVIASHLGRPRGAPNESDSLRPVCEKLEELAGFKIRWAGDCGSDEARAIAAELEPGGALLLENLRFHPGEEKNDPAFAAQLRELADFYVNDAFGACHRAHASISALAELFPSERRAGGLLLAKELEFLQKVTAPADRPFVAILGGAKIAGKIEPLEALAGLADTLLIGGGMANTFLASRGREMGRSLVDRDSIPIAKKIDSPDHRSAVVLPEDVVVTDSIDNPVATRICGTEEAIGSNEMAVDIGPKTIESFASRIASARMIFWNGPMGVFENPLFARGTMAIAEAIAANHEAVSVVGGGESVEAVNKSGFAQKITHISTGGGAALEFISGASLPGVEVLRTGESPRL